MEERYLTVEQVAERLQVRRETVREWLRRGLLPGVRLGDRTGWRIRPSDLERFLDARRSGEAAA